MTDNELLDLFKADLTSEEDQEFINRVTQKLLQSKNNLRIILAIRAISLIASACAIVILMGVFQILLISTIGVVPEIMGVPAPLAIAAVLSIAIVRIAN